MAETKEVPLERKEEVVALYLMGNIPEKISERLSLPIKNVRKDLRNMGIKVIEDDRKTREQILLEARQEIELIKQELWNMYVGSRSNEEKIKIASELRQLIAEKADCVQKMEAAPLKIQEKNKENLWKEVKENFFGQDQIFNAPARKGISPVNQEQKIPEQNAEVMDISTISPCSNAAERLRLLRGEEVPTKNYTYSPEFKDECEKDREKLEIIDWSERLKNAKEKTAQKSEKKEKTIEEKVMEFEKNRKTKADI